MNNGLLLVNKPPGITSFDVVRRVRRWCGTRQVGHCGTLDPAASGLLPVAVGSTTRLVEYLMDGDKEYVATLHLGVVTDTQDGEGAVVEQQVVGDISRAAVESAAAAFRGTIQQIPPMYSALKRAGVPLYKLAREGVDVERAPRTIRIDLLEILEITPPFVRLRVVCSKGTYIRTLCHDLGRQLGCGGHMAALCRTRCGSFEITASQTLAELESLAAQGQVLPMLSPADALPELPAIRIREAARQRLANGIAPGLSEVAVESVPATGGLVRLLYENRLAAIARYVQNGDDARSGGFVLDKVFPETLRLA